ncbi:unnamed protein product [Calypogeia fissa]
MAEGAHELPSHTALYLEPSYWNDRFAREEHYEWFKDYSHFRHLILNHMNKTDRVLEVGCGNSQMGEEIYKDGFTQMTRTDLSPVVIDLVQKRSAGQGCEGIQYKVADMLDLPFDDNSFDIVIEKGTVDCLFVNSGDPWKPKAGVAQRVKRVLEEIHRVLTPTGMFISIAFGQPHFRRPFFEAEGLTWSMKWETFGESFHYFFYTLRKGTKARHEGPSGSHLSKSNVTFDLEHEFMDNEDYLLHSTIGDDE